jgi:iron complex outermembrane receptor protein
MKRCYDAAALVVVASVFGLIPARAVAQTAPAASTPADPEYGEIIVTAQKREERLQDVPTAVSAFGENELARLGIQDADDLVSVVPNLQFGTTDANSRISIRGIGASDTNFAADPGVAFHIDGIYQTRASGPAGAAFFDIERVEILRGPQGTLYGRNSTGGAINVISAKPSDSFEGYGELLYGAYNRMRARSFLNVPLGTVFAVRVTAEYDKSNGYIDNFIGPDLADRDNLHVRGQIRFRPGAAHDLILRGVYGRRRGIGPALVLIEPTDNRSGNPIVGGGGTPVQIQNSTRGLIARYSTALPNISIRDPYKVRSNSPTNIDTDTYLTNAEYTLDLGGVAVKLLGAYQKGDEFTEDDGDRTELFIATRTIDREYEQTSAEVNISSTGSGSFQWIVGAFWLKDKVDQFLVSANNPSPTANTLIRDDSFEGKTIAGFGQATLRLGDALSITAGARYTRDEKSGSQFGRDFNGSIRTGTENGVWKEPTYRLGTEYRIGPDNLLYASYSRGYKAGGFRFLPTVGANDPDGTYDPEFVKAIELGSKNQFANRRVTLNLAGFHYDYTDLQFLEIRDQQQIVSNIGAATIWGLEVELNYRSPAGFRFDFSGGYLNAKIDDYIGPNPRFGALNPANPDINNPANINPGTGFPIDASGNRLPQSPEWSANFGISYNFDMDTGGEITPQARVSWQSETYFTPFNSTTERQDSFAKINLSLNWRSADSRLNAELFVNNVTDIATRNYVVNGSATTGTLYQANYAEPFTWGLRFGVSF